MTTVKKRFDELVVGDRLVDRRADGTVVLDEIDHVGLFVGRPSVTARGILWTYEPGELLEVAA